MTENTYLAMINGTFNFLGAVFAAYMAYMMAQLNNKASTASKAADNVKETLVIAAAEVDHVKTTLAKTSEATTQRLNEIVETGKSVHTLVNSNMGIQLKLNMAFAKRVAELTVGQPSHVNDVEAAAIAEAAYQEHLRKQAVVDRATAPRA